jgi:hypothetical protein
VDAGTAAGGGFCGGNGMLAHGGGGGEHLVTMVPTRSPLAMEM